MALIKVVLIDPDIEIHKWFRKHLIEEVSSESHVKYQLTAYTSSSDAVVDVMRYSNADLIIAETHMPGLDPLKAETIVPFLKKYNITIPVIAISSSSEELNKCSDAGVKDFWRKPIHIGRLNYLKGYLGVTEDQSKEKAVIPEEKTCDEGKKSSRRREWTDEMKSQFDRVIQSVGIHVTPTAIMKAMNNPNVHISQVQNRLHTLRSRERRGERKKPHQLEEEQVQPEPE